MTQAVYDEITVNSASLPGSNDVKEARGKWIKVHGMPPKDILQAYHVSQTLSQADASILALAVTLNAGYLLADDKALRHAAQLYRLTLIGTGGILIRFKQLGYVRSVKIALADAINLGLRLDKKNQELILKAAGE